jgi:hypothetical protein
MALPGSPSFSCGQVGILTKVELRTAEIDPMQIKLPSNAILFPLVGAFASVLFAHIAFGGFFPGPNGMGHDHAGIMPGLLADYYWGRSSGVFTPPWFTPAFCGGIPYFADPGTGFYSFPSFLVRLLQLDPLAAAYSTFLSFVFVGFLGTYLFCTQRIALSISGALLAALLFSLNGFFIHRFLIGHTGFHGVMLAPWLAYFTVSGLPSAQRRFPADLLNVVGGALVLAYWVYSGAQSLIVALGLSAAALILLAWFRNPVIKPAIQRSLAIIALGLALSASKIVAGFSYMAQFPRSDYRLPGFDSLADTAWVLLLTLFQNRTDIAAIAASKMQNLQWFQDRHELEYGLTWVPLILLVLVICARLLHPQLGSERPRKSMASWLSLSALVLILVTPIVINTYSPAWNAFLKSIPLIGSSSSLLRWFILYVPIIAVASGLLIDKIPWEAKARLITAAVAGGAFLVVTASVDRNFYLAQNYDPKPVVDAFRTAAAQPNFLPAITSIGVMTDASGNVVAPMNRNELVAYGASQLLCYNAIFGYSLEHFPIKTLRPGPTLDESAGVLNIKNPACYVYPKENLCAPGDHFPVSRKEDAIKFLSYKPFNFYKSSVQKAADAVTKFAVALWLILMVVAAVGARRVT